MGPATGSWWRRPAPWRSASKSARRGSCAGTTSGTSRGTAGQRSAGWWRGTACLIPTGTKTVTL